MSKTFIGIIIIIALTACDTPPQAFGTGGNDPEFQNLVAVATQTAASAQIAQTATSRDVTQQAAYTQATAVSYQATASKEAEIVATQQAYAQETAVSATETAIYEPVSLQQTREAQAVLMARENAASTATAVAVQLQIESDAKAAQRWDLFWTITIYIVAVTGFAYAAVLMARVYRFVRPIDPVYDDNGNVVAFDRQLMESKNVRHVSRPTIIENQMPQIDAPYSNMPPTKPIKFTRQNGEQTVLEVNDPSPNIDPMKWQIFAAAVLIDEIPPTRRAITEHNAYISQADHKEIYDFLIDNELAHTGAGDALVLDVGAGWEFLLKKLPPHMWHEVTLPHPDGLELVLD